MAKQVGPLFFTGTIDGIIFYELNGKYYTRSKGAYKSAKHMRRNPKYKRTMENADRFGSASKLVQVVYYHYLPKALRKQGVYGQLTGLLYGWLQEGKSEAQAREALITHCQAMVETTINTPTATVKENGHVKASTTGEESAAVKPSIKHKPVMAIPVQKPKQARYLSRWKVKHNGQLHIPKRDITVNQHLP
jgi:hypothetical protein